MTERPETWGARWLRDETHLHLNFTASTETNSKRVMDLNGVRRQRGRHRPHRLCNVNLETKDTSAQYELGKLPAENVRKSVQLQAR